MGFRLQFRVLAVLIGIFASHLSFAQGNSERGRELAETCMGCHGVESMTNAYPTYRIPKLGGQYGDYIVAALTGYKTKDRAHSTMHSQAATLNNDDMRDIGAYFESLGAAESTAKGTAPEAATVCITCHGDTGKGISPAFPSINGQYPDYLAQALSQYQSGERKNPIMAGFVGPLTKEDIKVLSAYYSNQPGLSAPKPDGP